MPKHQVEPLDMAQVYMVRDKEQDYPVDHLEEQAYWEDYLGEQLPRLGQQEYMVHLEDFLERVSLATRPKVSILDIGNPTHLHFKITRKIKTQTIRVWDTGVLGMLEA